MWIGEIKRVDDKIKFSFCSEKKEKEEKIKITKVKKAYKEAIKNSNNIYKVSEKRNFHYGSEDFRFIAPHKNKIKVESDVLTGKVSPEVQVPATKDNIGAIYCRGKIVGINHSEIIKISKLLPEVEEIKLEDLADMGNLPGAENIELKENIIIINGFLEFTYNEIADGLISTIKNQSYYLKSSENRLVQEANQRNSCNNCEKEKSKITMMNQDKIGRHTKEMSICSGCILKIIEKSDREETEIGQELVKEKI